MPFVDFGEERTMDLHSLGSSLGNFVDRLEGKPETEAPADAAPAADAPPAAPAAPPAAPASRGILSSLPSLSDVRSAIASKLPTLPSLSDMRSAIATKAAQKFDEIAGAGSAENIGWLQRNGPPTKNITQNFQNIYTAAAAGTNPLPPDAKDYHYLTVGGLFTQHYNGYLDPNRDTLKKDGLDVKNVPINTDTSVEENAKVIRDAIMDATKDGHQVVIMGHSKGGCDVTAALALYPELRTHVRAVVSMQAPYGGTPMASDIENTPSDHHGLTDAVNHFITGVLKGNPESLSDLSYESRQAFIKAHPYPADQIPTISLSSSCTTLASATSPAQRYMQARYGLPSDGLVLTQDAEIPGSSVVRLQNLDHNGSVWDNSLEKAMAYKPEALTQALVTLALQTPRPQQ